MINGLSVASKLILSSFSPRSKCCVDRNKERKFKTSWLWRFDGSFSSRSAASSHARGSLRLISIQHGHWETVWIILNVKLKARTSQNSLPLSSRPRPSPWQMTFVFCRHRLRLGVERSEQNQNKTHQDCKSPRTRCGTWRIEHLRNARAQRV